MSTTTPAVRPTTMGLPTTIGLIVALAGPFLVQSVLAPLVLQSRFARPARCCSAKACCGCRPAL